MNYHATADLDYILPRHTCPKLTYIEYCYYQLLLLSDIYLTSRYPTSPYHSLPYLTKLTKITNCHTTADLDYTLPRHTCPQVPG